MKRYLMVLLGGFSLLSVSCKKNSSIEELGAPGGKYVPQLSVSLSNKTPLVGEMTRITATTSQRNDKIAKVEFVHTLSERFGVELSLDNTLIKTWDLSAPLMVVRDTMIKEVVWKRISAENRELDNYFMTLGNNYVVPAEYEFVKADGKYPSSGAELLRTLPVEAFEIVKGQLANVIGVADYSKLFPSAPDANFVISGGVKTAVSAVGKTYLRGNLTREIIISNGLKEVKKHGALTAVLTVRVTTVDGAVNSVSNNIESIY